MLDIPPLYTLPFAFFTARGGDTRKVSRDSLDRLIACRVPLIEPKNIVWSEVQRTVFFAYQHFQYVYPDAVHNLTQHLIVQPRRQYAGQRLLDFKLAAEPIPLAAQQTEDLFGNTVLKLEVAQISHWTSFEVMFCIENQIGQTAAPVSSAEAGLYLPSTRLTAANNQILEVAKKLQHQSSSSAEFAERVADWISQTMQYKNGVTNVQTTAAQALEIGSGLCQDYSHIMLAICRAVGLPARYVSGHMLGEGSSHAWCEVLLEQGQVIAFDPTNARQPNLGYTVVAIGRDYTDVPPTSGAFIGGQAGQLHFEKYAGLLEVEHKTKS